MIRLRKYNEMYLMSYYLSDYNGNNFQKSSLKVSNLEKGNSLPKIKKRSFLYSLWEGIH